MVCFAQSGRVGRPRSITLFGYHFPCYALFLLCFEQYRALEKLKVLLLEPALCGLLATLTSMQLITLKGLPHTFQMNHCGCSAWLPLLKLNILSLYTITILCFKVVES